MVAPLLRDIDRINEDRLREYLLGDDGGEFEHPTEEVFDPSEDFAEDDDGLFVKHGAS